ncbi:unnamed protein product [Choristocarpus tenellus]
MATRLEYDELFKIVLVGDAAVGKTNLLAYYTSQDKRQKTDGTVPSFSSNRKATVGVEFATMIVTHPDGKRIKAQIWDTAGQERYRAITSSHYKRASGALLVFDATNRKSFENATKVWLPELQSSAESQSTLLDCLVLVGNKIDLPNVAVSETEQQVAARRSGISSVMRTSAKTGKGVDNAFERLILRAYELEKARSNGGGSRAEGTGIIISPTSGSDLKSECC